MTGAEMTMIHSAGTLPQPVVGTLRVVDGRSVGEAIPCAAVLDPPSQAARGREDDRLFILLDLTGPVAPHLYRELREVIAQTYWPSSGSITAALRRAITAANRRLYQTNLRNSPTDRNHGGLACAILRDQDLFIARSGAVHACFYPRERGYVAYFSDGEALAPLGTGQVANVRLHHAFVSPGDALLLTCSALLSEAGDEGIRRVLTLDRVADILGGLEQVGGEATFTALVARWPRPGEVEELQAVPSRRESVGSGRQDTSPSSPSSTLSIPAIPFLSSLKNRASHLLSGFQGPSPSPTESRAESVVPARSVDSDRVEAPAKVPTGTPAETPTETPVKRAAEARAAEARATEARVEESPPRSRPVPTPRPVTPSPPPSPPSPPLVDGSAGTASTRQELEAATAIEYTPPRGEVIRPEPEPERPEEQETGPGLGELLGNGIGAVGRGFAAAAGAVGGGARTLARHILPSPDQEVRRSVRPVGARSPRAIPEENRAVMMSLAIGIPILLVAVVVVAYLTFGTTSRLQNLVSQAEKEVVLAQAADGSSDASRSHWEAALAHAEEALALKPDDQVAAALKAQAETALDLLDNIIRLQPVLLKDLGPGAVARRLAVHGTSIFVLDPAGGWVSELTMNQDGTGLTDPDDIPLLFKTGDFIGEGQVGRLVDLVWVDGTGGRQTSGLVALEEDGALLTYDPSWGSTSRSFLGVPPELPITIDTYDGRLYVLDAALNQIRRYAPTGDTYPSRPENYFVTPPEALATARDIAIDGHIYLLYNDGTMDKFLGGDPQPFEVQNVPGGLGQPMALAVDLHGSSDVIYVADQEEQGVGRVVALGSDGVFWAQFRADAVFTALETLAVDEANRRLYVISGGKLYGASLPLPQSG